MALMKKMHAIFNESNQTFIRYNGYVYYIAEHAISIIYLLLSFHRDIK